MPLRRKPESQPPIETELRDDLPFEPLFVEERQL
jgi:hypothetical protein